MQICILDRMEQEKLLYWCGSSYKDYLDFPREVQKIGGYELHRVQHGLDPLKAKPLLSIGAGVYEIRIAESTDAYRVFYVAKFEEAVYVLHAFKKKSTRGKAIPRQDVAVTRQRYKEVVLRRPAREDQ